MPSRPFLATLACLVSSYASGNDAEPGIQPMQVEGSARWGTITDLKEPHYPPSLTGTGAKVFIDISGRVLWSRELDEVDYTPGSEAAKAMLAPMRVVLPYWRFRPPLDSRCQPSGVPIKTRVSFDFSTDPPSLSTRTPDEVKRTRTINTVTRVDPVFPRDMAYRGWQGFTYARVTIDAAGNVTDVLAIPYPKRPDADLTPFADSTIHALRQWKFNPDAEGKGDRLACWEVIYRLESPPKERRRR